MEKVIVLTLAVLAFAAGSNAARHPIAHLIELYDYDRLVPVAWEEAGVREADGVVIRDIAYESPVGGEVTAFLLEPASPPATRGPGILFGHGGYGTRAWFMQEALACARAGAVCLLVDFPWARPAEWRRTLGNFAEPQKDRDVYIQSVVDLRRGLDLLQYHPLASGDVAYVGHSLGAQCGAILAAVDSHRLKATILGAGAPTMADIYLACPEPEFEALRANVGLATMEAYCEAISDFDGEKYVPWTQGGTLLFQFSRYERFFDEEAAARYVAAAAEPVEVKWYDAGHALHGVDVYRDRAAWLGERAGLAPIVW
jgi:pimeloyl-ACP methyl ester carboxylesterase